MYLIIPFVLQLNHEQDQENLLIFWVNLSQLRWALFPIVFGEKKRTKEEKERQVSGLQTMWGLDLFWRLFARRFGLCPEDFTLSAPVSAAMSATLSFPPVRKCTHDTNAIRVAWDTRDYRGPEQKSPTKCINGIYLRRHIGDRLP